MIAEKESNHLDLMDVLTRFPANGELDEKPADQKNPAIRLYGRRFYNGQTPIEYLAEFLLVFASPKKESGEGAYQLRLDLKDKPRYWPQDRLELKLFSFFPSSKLETRHPIHRQAYFAALEAIKERLDGSEQDKDETVRLIQSLFSGFVGVAKNRTWVTYSFLPASNFLLARELDWLHSKAIKNNLLESWKDVEQFFSTDRHNYMARGGELLFLQLVNLFSEVDGNYELIDLRSRLEFNLKNMLSESMKPIDELAQFIEKVLQDYKLKSVSKYSNLGWVPVASRIEALFFAQEMDNICSSCLSTLDKLDLLQTLCCIQVLRSLCFQARRFDNSEKRTAEFVGNYAWIVVDPEAKIATPIRQMAQNSFDRIEAMLYRVLRKKDILDTKVKISINEADKNGFQIFRKIAKEIGLVMPKTGGGQRFTLHQGLLRFLVAALLKPGERIRLTDFYQRVFAHYGIAISGQPLAIALEWSGSESGQQSYAIASSSAWVEEALQQGGFLVELSDAVSIVHNPGS